MESLIVRLACSVPMATAFFWGRLVVWHGYRDGVGEPVSSARILGRPACSLQVPHRPPKPWSVSLAGNP